MKNLRKDNKGFSLVELIVVVLIMAIIAVALAPQVLKWVNNSRISADQDTMQTVVGDLQTAMSNEKVFAAVKKFATTSGKDFVIDKNGVKTANTLIYQPTDPGEASDLAGMWKLISWKFTEYSGWKTNKDFKTKVSGNEITITIFDNGTVKGSMSANTDSIDN